MNYFNDCITVSDIKKRFRELMLQHHPDRHPAESQQRQNEITAAIIALYHQLLAGQHNTTHTDKGGKEHTYYYNEEQEQAIVDKISELLKLRLPDDVEIWLIGKWVWVKGNTKPHKTELKKAGLHWHSKRGCWYYKPYKGKTYYNKRASLSDLAYTYGAKQFTRDEQETVVAMG